MKSHGKISMNYPTIRMCEVKYVVHFIIELFIEPMQHVLLQLRIFLLVVYSKICVDFMGSLKSNYLTLAADNRLCVCAISLYSIKQITSIHRHKMDNISH